MGLHYSYQMALVLDDGLLRFALPQNVLRQVERVIFNFWESAAAI